MDDLGDRLLIAWLREEEWGITSFLDLLLRIFRALQEESHGSITTLITLYNKHQVISALGQGLVRSIPALMSEMVSDKAAQTWLEVWQELTSDYTQFQIPLRLLNAAVRYRQTKGDKRVLLELPIEERNLLKPLLGISEGGQ